MHLCGGPDFTYDFYLSSQPTIDVRPGSIAVPFSNQPYPCLKNTDTSVPQQGGDQSMIIVKQFLPKPITFSNLR